jgi:hypothetical protein
MSIYIAAQLRRHKATIRAYSVNQLWVIFAPDRIAWLWLNQPIGRGNTMAGTSWIGVQKNIYRCPR